MRVGIFDPGQLGHHPPYVAGVVEEVLRAGHEVVLATPVLADRLSDQPALDWVHTESFDPRDVSKGRRVLRQVAAEVRAREVDAIWNLNLDESIWALGGSLDGLTAVHVLHQVSQYAYWSRSMLAKARTIYLRRALRRLTATAPLLVHTTEARDVLEAFLAAGTVSTFGYPVGAPSPRDRRPESLFGRPTLLFVGQARPHKGLPVLLEAASLLTDVTIEIVGPQDPGVPQHLERSFGLANIRWIDQFVSDEELEEAYGRATVVVIPYLDSFRRAGHASGVLLEALACARPIVTTDAISSQLPPRYEGAVVVRRGDSSDLARGIDHALQKLDRLRRGSARGPDFVRRHHSYEAYVAKLSDLSQAAAASD